jgi:hypothetical protein
VDRDESPKASLKDAFNYAYELIYKLNDELEKPYDNPFEALDNLPCEMTILTFVDDE